MSDDSKQLQNTISEALREQSSLDIKGSSSKEFYGGARTGTPLFVKQHNGLINYDPKELVITARSGIRLRELENLLAEQGQMLAFEPPYFSENATLGGTIACGLSGPRRPYAGSVRDFVLGVSMINGKAEILRFGGEVMKNVAGYDISRLMVGAMGTLGLILDVSLKVLPLPEREVTLKLDYSNDDAIHLMNQWSGSPLPISAACYDGAHLYIRLSGAHAAVIAGSKRIGGDEVLDGPIFWNNLRELQHGFFNSEKSLWRLSVPSDSPNIDLPGKQLIDWGGAQRWFIAEGEEAKDFHEIIAAIGGHVSLFREAEHNNENIPIRDKFHPLNSSVLKLHKNLKHSFDPQGIFNPGRLYRDL